VHGRCSSDRAPLDDVRVSLQLDHVRVSVQLDHSAELVLHIEHAR
jgi:hypothetical protein